MDTFRARSGPFLDRYHYTPAEFEAIAAHELRSVDLFPAAAEPIRVDRFIEKRFNLVPEYDDLPGGLVGFTRFDSNGPVEVVVSRALADEGGLPAERRVKSTLAHEAGHILLHGQLFGLQIRSATRPLLEEDLDVANQAILCRDDRDNARRYDVRWWEYQANQMIGALLLPRQLALQALEQLLTVRGQFGIGILERAQREEAVQALADTFDVNTVVARIRIDQVYPESEGTQLPL